MSTPLERIQARARELQAETEAVLAKAKSEGRAAHHCHWPGCTVEVPPSMWGCRPHWFKLPRLLRTAIWASYVPGQEITKTPSEDYVMVARKVQEWIKEQEAR